MFDFKGHQVNFIKDKEPKYEITRLKNGMTILTESSSFPFYTDLGQFQQILFQINKKFFGADAAGKRTKFFYFYIFLLQLLMLLTLRPGDARNQILW